MEWTPPVQSIRWPVMWPQAFCLFFDSQRNLYRRVLLEWKYCLSNCNLRWNLCASSDQIRFFHDSEELLDIFCDVFICETVWSLQLVWSSHGTIIQPVCSVDFLLDYVAWIYITRVKFAIVDLLLPGVGSGNHFVMPGRNPRIDEARNSTLVVLSSRSASLERFSVHESRIYNLSPIRILEKWTWSWLLQQP